MKRYKIDEYSELIEIEDEKDYQVLESIIENRCKFCKSMLIEAKTSKSNIIITIDAFGNHIVAVIKGRITAKSLLIEVEKNEDNS